jgi:CBS domain-containing protein
MVARELITDSVPSVKPSDTAGFVLDWMGEFKLTQLPVVEEGIYHGLVTENDILDATDLKLRIEEIRLGFWDSTYILETQHFYQVIALMSRLRLELLPVLDEANRYLGVITIRDVVSRIGNLFAVEEPGGIITIEVAPYDYSLSEIGRILETVDAKALSLYVSEFLQGSNTLLLTLKVNVEDPGRIVAAFERFNYKVVLTYFNASQNEDYRRNLDAFLRFLDI